MLSIWCIVKITVYMVQQGIASQINPYRTSQVQGGENVLVSALDRKKDTGKVSDFEQRCAV